jgi:glutamate synthase (NADPH/NADH) large chain
MSLTNYIGSLSRNLLIESSSHCKLIKFRSPIVTNTDLGKIKNLDQDQFSHTVIPMLFEANTSKPGEALEKAIIDICRKAETAVDKGNNFVIISDREISSTMAPIPSLLAVSAIHHHLINAKKRMQIGLILETAEPREVNHFALLFAYGASVVNPYGAFAIIENLCNTGEIKEGYVTARNIISNQSTKVS